MMVCGPTVMASVVTVAVPPATGALRTGPPLMTKNTVPPGVPAPGAVGVTVAVIVTCSPKTEGSGTDVSVVVVAAAFTVCVSVPVEALKSPSPV